MNGGPALADFLGEAMWKKRLEELEAENNRLAAQITELVSERNLLSDSETRLAEECGKKAAQITELEQRTKLQEFLIRDVKKRLLTAKLDSQTDLRIKARKSVLDYLDFHFRGGEMDD